ncbi:DUF1453 domain-containing protein [Streptomyces sp. NPDC059009]|uniref:DUF1453 domain-containing protein n=1 Tax=Streptomyces sp. NPDC059009 TaxID=3346694 RepID=UPI00368954F4
MSGLTNVLVICAVVVLVIARQFKAQEVTADKRWWVVPAVLVFLAVRDPDLLDPQQRTLSAVLLGTEVLVGIGLGAAWARTTHLWRGQDGVVWSKSTKASALVLVVGMAARAGLFGVGALLDIHQGSPAMMLAIAATLLVRSGILVLRARPLAPAYGGADTSYAPRMPHEPTRQNTFQGYAEPLRKDRV